MSPNRKDWSLRLNDSLWFYRTAYKTPLDISPYRIIYGKACHFPLELEHKVDWVVKQLNVDMTVAAEQRKLQLCKLKELRLFSYENARIYKENTKQWHDQRIQQRKLIPGNQVLLYNLRLKLFPGKLKSRWLGPFKFIKVYSHGAVELQDERTCQEFKVNEHRVKHYMGTVVSHPREDLFQRDPTWAIKDGHTERTKNKL